MDTGKEKSKKEVLEDLYEKINFNSNYNNSIGKVSNWLLGIAIGLFSITVYELNHSCHEKINYAVFHKAVIVLTMLNLGFSGFIRHSIYVQEFRMNLFYDESKKLVFFDKMSISEEEFNSKFKKLAHKRLLEYNKTVEIHKWININTYSTIGIIFLFGILMLMK